MTKDKITSYSVDSCFNCKHKSRLYELIGCLKELALTMNSPSPYPIYLGGGNFQINWEEGCAEIQDTSKGVARLWTTPMNKSDYGRVRNAFSDYWNENYIIDVQDKAKGINRPKIKSAINLKPEIETVKLRRKI